LYRNDLKAFCLRADRFDHLPSALQINLAERISRDA
jgi:hypothetical protein